MMVLHSPGLKQNFVVQTRRSNLFPRFLVMHAELMLPFVSGRPLCIVVAVFDQNGIYIFS